MSSNKINEKTRIKVEKRANEKCEYCLSPMEFSTQRFEIEHIYPISLGGKTILSNLALACRGCNGFKAARIQAFDKISNEKVTLFHPRKDSWNKHFAWDTKPEFIIGLTPNGRATIVALKLNRSFLISLRKHLIRFQMHPPSN